MTIQFNLIQVIVRKHVWNGGNKSLSGVGRREEEWETTNGRQMALEGSSAIKGSLEGDVWKGRALFKDEKNSCRCALLRESMEEGHC